MISNKVGKNKVINTSKALTKKWLITIFVLGVIVGAGFTEALHFLFRPAPTPAEAAPIVIGIEGPFTGPAALVGDDIRKAAILAFEEINYRLIGRPVKLVFIDDESKPEKGVAAMEEAIMKYGMKIMISGWHSSVAVAQMDIAAKYKVFCVGHMGATAIVNEKYAKDPEKYKYWFKGWPIPLKLHVGYAEVIKEIIENKIWTPKTYLMASVTEDTDYARAVVDSFKTRLGPLGFKFVANYFLPMDTTDFYSIIMKLKELKIDIVIHQSAAIAFHANFLRQARELGLNALFIGEGYTWKPKWYEITGEASDYVIDMAPKFLTPKAKAFRDKFIARWGTPPAPAPAGLTYDWCKFVIAVIEKAGTDDPDKLVEVARTMEFRDGVMMNCYKFYDPGAPGVLGPPDPVVGKGYFIFPVLQCYKGDVICIWPPEWREESFMLPPWLKSTQTLPPKSVGLGE